MPLPLLQCPNLVGYVVLLLELTPSIARCHLETSSLSSYSDSEQMPLSTPWNLALQNVLGDVVQKYEEVSTSA